MKFLWQNCNDFNSGIRWHDYLSIMINEFPIILVRKYDWPSEGDDGFYHAQVMGFRVYHKYFEE